MTLDDGFLEESSFFGSNGGIVTDGPITAIFARGPRSAELKIRSLVPDIEEINSNFFIRDGEFSDWFSTNGNINSFICPQERLVSGVECRGDRCNELRIRCSAAVQDFFIDESFISSTTFGGSTRKTKKKVQCAKGFFLQGMSCKSPNCGRIQLHCARVSVKAEGGIDEGCKDFEGWRDYDGNTCDYYSDPKVNENYCNDERYADEFGRLAKDACCVCGGGTVND